MIARYPSHSLLILFLMTCLGALISPVFHMYSMIIVFLTGILLSTSTSKITDLHTIWRTFRSIKTVIILISFLTCCLVIPQITFEVNPLAKNYSEIQAERNR